MIVYMPVYMLAGWTKFIPLRLGYVLRLHIKRIKPFGLRLPLGILTIEYHKKTDLDALADKYTDHNYKLTQKDIEWAQKLVKENN